MEEERLRGERAGAKLTGLLGLNKAKEAEVETSTKKVEDGPPDLMKSPGGQGSLRRVLRAYAIYDQDTGYCQGMNFIAAMFITFMSEEEAFWLLVYVMNDQPCKMRDLFGRNMTQTTQILHVADCLVTQFLPKLSTHFEKENVHISMYATQWLLTVFTSTFPFELVTRVWDCFLAEGWKIVYRVMLAILTANEGILLKMPFEEILGWFRDCPNLVEAEGIFEVAFKIPLKKKHIEKYEKEWIVEQKRNQR